MKLPAFKKPIIKHCIKILAILINIKYNNKEYTEQNYSLVISSTYKKNIKQRVNTYRDNECLLLKE